jgi:hypothetical protein
MADEDPSGAISAALGQYSEGNTAEAQALALNQLAHVMENLQKGVGERLYRPAAIAP